MNYVITYVYSLDELRIVEFPIIYEYNTIFWKCVYIIVAFVISIPMYKIYEIFIDAARKEIETCKSKIR